MDDAPTARSASAAAGRGSGTVDDAGAGLLGFSCPRCHQQVSSRFYGPCESCRGQLRAAFAGSARDIAAERFEPRMHVVANHVATKD